LAERLTIANEVWIAAALLQREQLDRESFSAQEIQSRLARENIFGQVRAGVGAHVYLHCVAVKPANAERHRYLTPMGRGRYRLFRSGDAFDPTRSEGKTHPRRDELPDGYRQLVDWYEAAYAVVGGGKVKDDPILALRGLGVSDPSHRLSDEEADAYVASLREGW
jgi:hypothetical protein